MNLHGKNFVGATLSSLGSAVFHAVDPARASLLEPTFHEATTEEVDNALHIADSAFEEYRRRSPEERASFLDRLADEIVSAGSALVERAVAETGLPEARIVAERGRTTSQIRMFAALIRDGSWVEARIDRADPERKPLPKPDVRRMLVPVGPAVVFGASNFPLAFSAAGGDTASALAAGSSVVVKAHPAHPGTSEIVASAVLKAIREAGMPDGLVSMLHGAGHEVGLALVRHPLTRAVAFTGSLRGGRALFDAACARPDPVPVFAEMGSVNPVFLLPRALKERGSAIADGLQKSVTLGVGQFCTNPGVVVGVDGRELDEFLEALRVKIEESAPGTMLHEGIRRSFEHTLDRLCRSEGVDLLARSRAPSRAERTEAGAALCSTLARFLLKNPELREEVFGPSTLVVRCSNLREIEDVARSFEGSLTATVHGTAEDLEAFRSLVSILERKSGRLVYNGFPTGVEVCPAMQHGGPYPATTDSRATSVGTAAIQRFVRPVAYQDFPQEALPVELRDRNERGIWRLLDGSLGQGDA